MQYLDNDIQTFLAEAGEAGCCALCLCEVASRFWGKPVDVVKCLKLGVEKGDIYYNAKDKNDNDNFYVSFPATFLYHLTGKHWDYRHESANYKAKKSEYVFNRWERQKTGVTTGHFEFDDFKPVKDSLTVQYGKLVSTRVCKVIEG